MTEGRREVRATQEFFADLDAELPSERGPNGEPSAHDFLVTDLFRIIETFATGFDDLPHLGHDHADVRIHVTSGRLVAFISIMAELASDGAVELISLDLDFGFEPDSSD